MSIRSTVKAVIIKNGKILLNKCHDETNGDYYSLPGGGQHQYETLHEAVIRECLEETGYTVIPVRFAALCESIVMNDEYRKNDSEYTHKMYHIFICELTDEAIKTPTEKDTFQISSEWFEIDSLNHMKIFPRLFGENIRDIIANETPVFLGSEYIGVWHG